MATEKDIWKKILSGNTQWIPDSWVFLPPILKVENGIKFRVKGTRYQGQIEIIYDTDNKLYSIFIVKDSKSLERKHLWTIPFKDVIHAGIESSNTLDTFPKEALDLFAEDYGLIPSQ